MRVPIPAATANFVGRSVAGAVALLALAATGLGTSVLAGGDGERTANGDSAVIQLRIWQHVDEPEEIWISARPRGGRWDTLGTIPVPESGYGGGHSETSRHRYGAVAIAGVGLHVWQRQNEPSSIYVEACAETCRQRPPAARLRWWPLGKNRLPLDDGLSRSGRYRYGDLTVSVPRGNAALLEDRERLLALRDVLEGDGTELDWSVGTPTQEWPGVTVGGTPSRVTGLDLSELGLRGEIWGYVGDLTELTELRLDGNALTGRIPSKVVALAKLTRLRLGGNEFEGCVPPPLRGIPDHDLDDLGLPDCGAPPWTGGRMTAGIYYFMPYDRFGEVYLWEPPYRIVFDVPAERALTRRSWGASSTSVHSDWTADTIFDSYALGISLHDADDEDTWLFLSVRYRDGERERSHYAGCVYDCGEEKSPAALLEQLAASVWINSAPVAGDVYLHSDPAEWWVWP